MSTPTTPTNPSPTTDSARAEIAEAAWADHDESLEAAATFDESKHEDPETAAWGEAHIQPAVAAPVGGRLMSAWEAAREAAAGDGDYQMAPDLPDKSYEDPKTASADMFEPPTPDEVYAHILQYPEGAAGVKNELQGAREMAEWDSEDTGGMRHAIWEQNGDAAAAEMAEGGAPGPPGALSTVVYDEVAAQAVQGAPTTPHEYFPIGLQQSYPDDDTITFEDQELEGHGEFEVCPDPWSPADHV